MNMKISSQAEHQASQLGVELEEFRVMLKASARITHKYGNRRFNDFLFTVTRKGVVINIHLISCINCYDTKRINVENECSYCLGEGCSKCNGGFVSGTIRCPECN